MRRSMDIVSNYISRLKSALDCINVAEVVKVKELINDTIKQKRKIIIFGNGGSAATASHIMCDINKGVSYGQMKRYNMICLNDNIPTMLAYGNDISFEVVFLEQLKNVLESNDVVIAISGSGNSKNIIKAIKYANSKNALTIGMTGCKGGVLKKIAQYNLHVNIDDMQISEDIHLIFGHILMKLLCE